MKLEGELEKLKLEDIDKELMMHVKQYGFSDVQIAYHVNEDVDEDDVRYYRKQLGVLPSFQLVDTCAGEFPAQTPYFYSTYETENESVASSKEKVIILGSGPNRIGQGIEFDYSCVHGVISSQRDGVRGDHD